MTALSGNCANTYAAHRALVLDCAFHGVRSGYLPHQRVFFCRIGKSSFFVKHQHEQNNQRCVWPGAKGRGSPFCGAWSLLPPQLAMRASSSSSTDDGLEVNGAASMTSAPGEVEEVKFKLDVPMQGRDADGVIVQAIHDAARATELAIREHTSLMKSSWFSRNWLGVDKNAWIKTLSNQAAVYSLLQAAIEKSSLERNRDIHLSVEKSLLRLSVTLESSIQEQLCAKDPKANEWFWSQQHPIVMKTFTDIFSRDFCFKAATRFWNSEPSDAGTASDILLLMLALTCLSAIFKIGSAKISCSPFYSILPDVSGKLMDALLNFLPIDKVYSSMKDIGLRREFLSHFGHRATIRNVENVHGVEEITFWVNLVQKRLQQAVEREKIWSRLTTCESIEVLEKDLAIFGFFIALGRSSQTFLSLNGLTTSNEKLEGIVRYLIGGSILYYPQLSSISSYQLFVEVVCEELDWLPFYWRNVSNMTLDNKGTEEKNSDREATLQVLLVCFYWTTSFIKYSEWLQNPSHIKAARFLSRGHDMIKECLEELDVPLDKTNREIIERQVQDRTIENLPAEDGLGSFDKALENVEEALNRLEDLLQESHLSNSNPGKEHLQAACSDLERIRKLKKEAEFLEVSFRAKAASLQQGDTDGNENVRFQRAGNSSDDRLIIEDSADSFADSSLDKPRGFWSFLVQSTTKRSKVGLLTDNTNVSTTNLNFQDSESNEISRFQQLRHELIELEKRVQRSTAKSQTLEPGITYDNNTRTSSKDLHMLVLSSKKENFIAKSVEKIKETTTDVLQGTQLLAIDVSAALVLLKRVFAGDELTEKEKKALQRTLTDLASVIPIGFLMLLPVTAVGHAAILAFIQRYVPAMIPSTYAPERLDLLRQLAKLKELESADGRFDKATDSVNTGASTID